MSVKYSVSDVNALILRVREGDQQAFSELLDRYRPLINSLISKFGQGDLAKTFVEDLRQEAIVVFYNAILTYSENQSDVEFGLYARICISNALVSQIRSINRRRVEQCVDELAVSKCMREQRIIVDLRKQREVYLRIMGISMGIPQIVDMSSQFVEDGKNGVVLENTIKLQETLAFYLENLANWNEAMVYSYEIGKKYTTRVLIEKWKEVIEFVGNDSSTSAGEA